jgi:hypothetical protein
MNSLRLISTSIICLILLINCSAQQITQTNYSKIKTGMSAEEVIRILGEPDKSSGADFDPSFGVLPTMGTFSGTHMFWREGDNTVIIEFLNDKVRLKSFTNQF